MAAKSADIVSQPRRWKQGSDKQRGQVCAQSAPALPPGTASCRGQAYVGALRLLSCTLPGTALGYSSSAGDIQHRAELLRASMDWLCMPEGPGLCKQAVVFICNNLYTIVRE